MGEFQSERVQRCLVFLQSAFQFGRVLLTAEHSLNPFAGELEISNAPLGRGDPLKVFFGLCSFGNHERAGDSVACREFIVKINQVVLLTVEIASPVWLIAQLLA